MNNPNTDGKSRVGSYQIGSLAGRSCYSVRTNKAVLVLPKMGDCRECGCQCALCNTNGLDFQHEIEVLKASLKEARLSASSYKNETKQAQAELQETRKQQQVELEKAEERYQRLLEGHRHLEVINHDLEDKILSLVQHNEAEREATMAIHEDIHKKLKEADKRVEDILHEKDTLAAQCKVAVDLLKNSQAGGQQISSALVAREVTRLRRVINSHEESHPVIDREVKDVSPSRLPITTFPPCAAMFDHSPKAMRKHLLDKALPRNASDSRLANMAAHPTDIKLCSKCREVSWTRSVETQTSDIDSFNCSDAQHGLHIKSKSAVFDV
ncbi:brain-enriched guanylate kinase-associated protein-like isoform X2 [Watersipora subatra]|uniref:brain-enriched guanylate kinase-associated protein-like isoform X2 n=1 Tax=Watersipora subatra TaxID=2589382 RepID=UPI00355C876B